MLNLNFSLKEKIEKYSADQMEVMRVAGERHLWEQMKEEEQRQKGDEELENQDQN